MIPRERFRRVHGSVVAARRLCCTPLLLDLPCSAQTFLGRFVSGRNQLLCPVPIPRPNPKCGVCAPSPEVICHLNLDTATLGLLAEEVLKKGLGLEKIEMYRKRDGKQGAQASTMASPGGRARE
jgi:hypothetical protein